MIRIITPILFVLFSLSNACFAQTKQETEEWILSKLNNYSNSGLSLTDVSFQKTLKFHIKDGKLIGRNGQFYYSIDIKSIKDFSYDILEGFKDDDFGNIPSTVSIKLHCNGNCVNAYSGQDTKSFPKLDISMDNSFKNENLPERMKKAFKNLVQFYGGQFITEKY